MLDIPDLKKSLVSLGTLNSQGYRYFAEGGVLRVSKGAYVCRLVQLLVLLRSHLA